MDNSISVPVDAGGDQTRQAPLFTPQEEAALRHYSEAPKRFEAMVAAGYVASVPDISEYQRVVAQMGDILGRAEQMTLAQVAFSVGADKVAFCGRLWHLCQSENDHAAIKAMVLMGRIHGMFDKADHRQPQVALVFTSAQGQPTEKPVDLPFTMSSADYSVFSDPNVPRGTAEKAG